MWKFNDSLSNPTVRSWSFKRPGSSDNEIIARIIDNGNVQIIATNPVIAIEKPSTLVLKNVSRRHIGKYKFQLMALAITDSEVVVKIAGKFLFIT